MINASKKFSNIPFQNPASLGIILTNLIKKFLETIDRSMSAFLQTARIAIANKSPIKKRIKQTINSMMQ